MAKNSDTKNLGLSRRSLLKSGAQLAGAGLLPVALARNAFAETYPALGTFPAGSAGASVFVGLTTPLTGTYAAQGVDERKGFELAIEHLNAGHALMKKYSPLTTKGVLGKQVTLGVADSEAKPNTAVQAQTRFITENKAVMIAGCVSSAVAVALNKLSMREKVIYLPGISGSNDTTGKDCARYSFRECHYAYSAAAALAPELIKTFGKNKKVAFLTPDYTYGHSVTSSMQEFLKPAGWTTVTDQVAPLGTPDYNTYLLNIANSGADVLININFGNDAVNSIKQANQLGILQKMKLVMPYISPFLSKQAGPELMAGVYGTTEWWWTLSQTNEMAKMFVDEFKAKNGYTPEWGAHAGYVQVALWADAVEHAKTFYPPEVIKSYESGRKLTTDMGEVSWRAEDHQLVRPVYIVKGKAAKDMKSPDDYFEIIETVAGAGVMQKPDAFGCKLGSAT
ncbi:MAG: substrate-binding protein [Hyphomicrobiales bacterium]|nr:substrate-binding protein [Hyphomicrobiales bacterium]MDE2113576.1 substrate-binding protein [Hyphomicrobiales bacterium]